MKKNGYALTRAWFQWVQENPEQVTASHTALFCWLVELNNQTNWNEKFSAPTNYCMVSSGIKHHSTYRKVLNDLIKWKFVIMLRQSINQYTASVISLNCPANISEAVAGQYQGSSTIYKPNKPNKPNKPIPPAKKTEVDEEDFIDRIIKIFQNEYQASKNIKYEILSKGKEWSAAGKILGVFKKNYPEDTGEQIQAKIREFFHRALNINDQWLQTNMSLPIIQSKFNEINQKLTNGNLHKTGLLSVGSGKPRGSATAEEHRLDTLERFKQGR